MVRIEILGMGCGKCNKLAGLVKDAVAEISDKAEIVKVEDVRKIMEHGVMNTPALVINGKVMSAGRIPEMAEIRAMIGASKAD